MFFNFQIQLQKVSDWDCRLDYISMCVNSRHELILRGIPKQRLNNYSDLDFSGVLAEKRPIKVCNRRTGELITELMSKWNHHSRINELPTDVNCMLEACEECNMIRVYNIRSGAAEVVLKNGKPRMICNGPEESVLIMDSEGCVSQLRWNENRRMLNAEHQLQTHLKDVLRICYIKKFSILAVCTSYGSNDLNNHTGTVTGIQLKDGTQKWTFGSCFAKRRVYPRAICNDEAGRIFVGDYSNNRFLILDGNSGCVLKLIQLGLELPKPIWKMFWVDTQPNLIVHNSVGVITHFNVDQLSVIPS